MGTDRETDVGLIRLLDPPKNLAVARIGDSRNLVPGQWAIAIGNPYGYQQTVTLGVIGHTGRAVRVEDRVYKSLIQTDAAINPGNSGGALVDIHGNVIGINTVVRADAQGIGFAIPIHVAKGIADELSRNGKVKRPWTGLNVQDVTPDLASYLGLSRAEGAVVDQMDRRGPAWQAGIRPGDLIREIGGKKIRTRKEVDDLIASAKIGDHFSVVVEREGELYKGEIRVGEKP
jgi:S1-C subfamily serine protease